MLLALPIVPPWCSKLLCSICETRFGPCSGVTLELATRREQVEPDVGADRHAEESLLPPVPPHAECLPHPLACTVKSA